MARSSECKEQYAQKTLDTADIVRDAMLRQQWATVPQVLATQSPTEKPEASAEAKSEDQ
jgi:hypothetical protein